MKFNDEFYIVKKDFSAVIKLKNDIIYIIHGINKMVRKDKTIYLFWNEEPNPIFYENENFIKEIELK